MKRALINFLKDERGVTLQQVLISALALGGFYYIWTAFIQDNLYTAGEKQGEWIKHGYDQPNGTPSGDPNP